MAYQEEEETNDIFGQKKSLKMPCYQAHDRLTLVVLTHRVRGS